MKYYQVKSKIVKTRIVLLFVLCWFSTNAFSQQFLVIKFKDGHEQAIPLTDIVKIDFRQSGGNETQPIAPAGPILPKPGIYRVGNNGPRLMFTNVTSTSISYAWWQTGDDYPPKMDHTTYFGRGTLTPLGGGVWRMSGEDQPGSSGEGYAVEAELRFLSPTSVEQIRGRWWKIGAARPPADQWMATGWEGVATLVVAR